MKMVFDVRYFPDHFAAWLLRRLKIYLIVAALSAQTAIGIGGFDRGGFLVLFAALIEMSILVPLDNAWLFLCGMSRTGPWGVVAGCLVLMFGAFQLNRILVLPSEPTSSASFTDAPLQRPAVEPDKVRPTIPLQEQGNAGGKGDAAVNAEGAGRNHDDFLESAKPQLVPKPSELVPDVFAGRARVHGNAFGSRPSPKLSPNSSPSSQNLASIYPTWPYQTRTGKVTVANTLGVIGQALSQDDAARYGLQAPRGVAIIGITAGSLAAAAGLKAGDVVLKIDGLDVEDLSALTKPLSEITSSRTVPVEIFRAGHTQVLQLHSG